MMSVLSRLPVAASLLLVLALPAASQAATYYPAGPQENVSKAALTSAGWSLCYSGDYGDFQSTSAIQSACTGNYLMLAGAPTGSSTYQLLAAAPHGDVQHAPGPEVDGTVISNGAKWYYAPSGAWGFAPQFDTVNRGGGCDSDFSNGPNNSAQHLCWHTNGSVLNPGYRLGATVTFASSFQRFILQSDAITTAVGTPDPLVFATQAQDTVSAVQTVSITVTGAPGDSLGALTVSGANRYDFFKQDDDCPTAVPSGGTVTCTAALRFIPSAQGARSATLSFPRLAAPVATLQGTGGALPQGPAGATGPTGSTGATGATGAAGTTGTTGATGATGAAGSAGIVGNSGIAGHDGANGTDGVNGKDGADGAKGSKGDRGPRGGSLKVTKVGCTVQARGAGARMVCKFNRRVASNLLVALRDSRGALSAAPGNGKTVMIFLARRYPRGVMHAFVIKGLSTR